MVYLKIIPCVRCAEYQLLLANVVNYYSTNSFMLSLVRTISSSVAAVVFFSPHIDFPYAERHEGRADTHCLALSIRMKKMEEKNKERNAEESISECGGLPQQQQSSSTMLSSCFSVVCRVTAQTSIGTDDQTAVAHNSFTQIHQQSDNLFFFSSFNSSR